MELWGQGPPLRITYFREPEGIVWFLKNKVILFESHLVVGFLSLRTSLLPSSHLIQLASHFGLLLLMDSASLFPN